MTCNCELCKEHDKEIYTLRAENAELKQELNGSAFVFPLFVEENKKLRAENEKLREALDAIIHELGVPQHGYPAPVTNACLIANKALAKVQP